MLSRPKPPNRAADRGNQIRHQSNSDSNQCGVDFERKDDMFRLECFQRVVEASIACDIGRPLSALVCRSENRDPHVLVVNCECSQTPGAA